MRRLLPPLLLALGLLGPAAAQVGAPTPGPPTPATQVLLGAPESPGYADLRAADDERVAAILAADPERLDAILSADLHYGHSNGVTEDKAGFIATLTRGRIVYQYFEYQRHRFQPLGEDVALMTGRALIRALIGDRTLRLDVEFLAVWRREGGRWRFLAWQSTPRPAAD